MSMSSEPVMELSTSCTSPLMRAMMSPLRSWLKKPRGRDRILLYISMRISFTIPVRRGTITAVEPK